MRAHTFTVSFFVSVLAACASAPGPVPPSAAPAPATSPALPPTDAGAPPARDDAAKPMTELWEGTLHAPNGLSLRMLLRVTRGSDGVLKGTTASPDEGGNESAVDTITRDDHTLAFSMTAFGATYSGKLNEAQTEAVGTFAQHGAQLALTLKKTDKASTLSRPQTPKAPFPYHSEDVTYPNPKGGTTLAGTLTTPNGDGPFPAVILITGSGAQDRDESIFEHKPFFVIADDLTRKGVAVLRVDDRGVGGSTGDAKTATSEDFAGDVLAGLAFLAGRKEIDHARMGLVGHSEGGLIAPMVASRSKDVAFVVLLAGPGLTGREILQYQNTLLAHAVGMPEDAIKHANVVNERIFALLASPAGDGEVAAKIRAIVEAEPGDPAASKASAEATAAGLVNPWFRYFVKYDPRPALAKMKCPALALNGEKDRQVPAKEDLAAIKKANPRIVTKELPGLNHLFQTAETGAPSEYSSIEETFAPAALAEISGFILAQTRRK